MADITRMMHLMLEKSTCSIYAVIMIRLNAQSLLSQKRTVTCEVTVHIVTIGRLFSVSA